MFDATRVRLEIAPLRPGPNAIRLRVTDPAGRPLADATAAMVQVTPADASVGAVTFQLDRAGPGEFVAPPPCSVSSDAGTAVSSSSGLAPTT